MENSQRFSHPLSSDALGPLGSNQFSIWSKA